MDFVSAPAWLITIIIGRGLSLNVQISDPHWLRQISYFVKTAFQGSRVPAGGVPLLPEPEGDLLGARQPRQVPHPAPGRALDGSVAGEGAPRAGRLQLRGQPQPDGQAVAAIAVPGTGTKVWNQNIKIKR